jgi:membrane protein YqaA with SNARE-associated domain
MIKILGWKISLADFKWSSWAIFICAFADASFIPFPIMVVFMTFALLDITKAYRYALIATLGTLAGGFAGYSIGHFAWVTPGGEFTGFAHYLFNHIPGFSEELFTRIHLMYTKWGLWILVTSAAIPLPFKIFSISSGVFDTNLLLFGITTLISHGVRFLLLAFLSIKAGHEIKRILETKLRLIAIVASSCIALIIIVIKIF